MLGAYGSAALVVVASLAIGQAILALSGRREATFLAGPVGLATLLTVSGIAVHLPGRATPVAIALIVLVALSLAYARMPRAVSPVLAGSIALLAASIPFAVNGRIDVLGVGLVNDDMASHLAIADWLWTHVGQEPGLVAHGYPLGPHALAAALASGLNTGLIEAFAGITLAIPVLTAMVAAELLGGLRRGSRVAAAVLVALPYLGVAYLAQEAFKEPTMALLLLAFAALLPSVRSPRGALPLGLIAAGTVYTYSFPGLAWLAGTAAIWAVLAWRGIKEGSEGGTAHRRPVLVVLAAVALLLALSAPDLGRLADFTGFRAFHDSDLSAGLGNLRHQLSPLEALGVWPTSEFRLSAADSSLPAIVFYAGAFLAATGLALGLPRWIRRHGTALPAGLAACIAVYLGARLFGTVYTSAKALAITAPFVLLLALGGLLQRSDGYRRPLAVVLMAAAALSSFLILRQAPVAPADHREQLAELRPLIQGQDVLFLGRDNFVVWELRGAYPYVAVRNYYDRHYVRPNVANPDVFRKFDFDSVSPRTLDRFPYVITTRAPYASGPPPSYELARTTDDFALWRRMGPVGTRRTLDEGAMPGARLDCNSGRGRPLSRGGGTATVFTRPPVGVVWVDGETIEDGEPLTRDLPLSPGRWAVSISYDSTRPVHVRAAGLDATVPANLDYRGSLPWFPAGEISVSDRRSVAFEASVERPPFVGRLLGTKAVAHINGIALSPAGREGPIPGAAETSLPLSRACGRYLDWYTR